MPDLGLLLALWQTQQEQDNRQTGNAEKQAAKKVIEYFHGKSSVASHYKKCEIP